MVAPLKDWWLPPFDKASKPDTKMGWANQREGIWFFNPIRQRTSPSCRRRIFGAICRIADLTASTFYDEI